jgi:hypothetical protein
VIYITRLMTLNTCCISNSHTASFQDAGEAAAVWRIKKLEVLHGTTGLAAMFGRHDWVVG